ncbi:MAG TPA: bifunctional phosphoribosylaminoimidazolecarboxamide formyltransferase/IMP cyclohydrolase [Vicinamibacterales bacterium]
MSDKTEIVSLARGLVARGFELVSTGGTARTLVDAGLAVTGVSDVTGFPEMLDGRVKTLHPKIHGGILARRGHPEDLDALARHGIGLVDLVVVNLYPFEATAKKPGVTFDELIENIDIGGPSMVRAAAKNFRDVLVVVEPKRYGDVLDQLDRQDGPSLAFRFELAVDALAHTARYDATICGTLAHFDEHHGDFERRPEPDGRPALQFTIDKVKDLRYGENPHQKGSLWEPRTARLELRFVQGRELSYTNLLDVDAAWRIAGEFTEPAAVVIKHTNPCGAATGPSPAKAYLRARDADALSAYGGIVGLNRPLDVEAAEAIVSTFIEAVVVPDVSPDALPILARKDRMRVIAMPEVVEGDWQTQEFRSLLGGVLMQDRDRVVEARQIWSADTLPEGVRVVTKRQPAADEWEALRFAWRVCAHVKSNAVIFTNATSTLAIGAGQMSRVDAVNVAVAKAAASKVSLAGSVAASDAFFPFRDGLDALATAGATAVVQPGGSVRDAEVIAAADEHGIAMVFTGRRHFRH